MRRSLWLIGSMCVLVCSRITVPAVVAAEESVALFEDDFSRYPPGPLTAPLGKLNGAIQEYHYLPHRGVPLEPWANAICHIDAWAAGETDGVPYLEQHLAPNHQDMVPQLFAPLFITGEPEWRDYTVEVSVCPLSTAEWAGVVLPLSHEPPSHRVFHRERQNGPTGQAAAAGGKVPRLFVATARHGRLPLRNQSLLPAARGKRWPANSRVHRRQTGTHGHATPIWPAAKWVSRPTRRPATRTSA